MCRKVQCPSCSRPTWAGCGKHIDSALEGVPEGDRCGGWRTGKCAPVNSTPNEGSAGKST